jgi:DNA-binding GntR family transcriptional regulator
MPFREEVTSFIRATFRSVWSLEMLLFLSDNSERSWSREELVASLRGSDLVVSQSLDLLVAAGLVSIDSKGCARFSPASADLARLAEATKVRYAKAPDAVRRLIISAASSDLTAFADAFKLRKD